MLKETFGDIEDVFSINRIKKILSIVSEDSESSNNNAFELFVVTYIFKSSNDYNRQLELIRRIYNIFVVNNFKLNKIVYALCDFLNEKFEEQTTSSENKKETYKLLLEIASQLTIRNIAVINIKSLLQYIIDLGIETEEGQRRIENLSIKYSNEDALYFHLLYSITEDLNEDNVDDYLKIVDEISNYSFLHRGESVSNHYYRLLNKLIEILSKKYVHDKDEYYEKIKFVFNTVDGLIESFGDQEDKDIMLSLINKYMKSSALDEKSYEFLYSIGIKAIEGKEIGTIKTISNYIGWHLFKKLKINKMDQEKFNKAGRIFESNKQYFKYVCDYVDDDKAISVFVGTIFVVNLVLIKYYIKYYKNINPSLHQQYEMYYKQRLSSLKQLNSKYTQILMLSFDIRKERLSEFFEDVNKDFAFKELCIEVKKELA